MSSAAEATALLAGDGEDAAVLAGGQSLLIDLRYRRARPRTVIDINRAAGLGRLTAGDGWLEAGALVRHRELEHAGVADPLAGLLARAARHVAHPPVRTRGTFCGSIAWAHPAAEWCALAVALGAEMRLARTAGTRTVPAAGWFLGPHRTARRPDELLTAVRLPLLGPGTGTGFAEHRRTHGSFAMAAAVAVVNVRGGPVDGPAQGPVQGLVQGTVRWARVGLASAGPVPVRARAAEDLLTGEPVSAELIAGAADAAAVEADPVAEPYCSPAYRRQALRVMVRRSLGQALSGRPDSYAAAGPAGGQGGI